jgi:hypothetical protein
MDDANLKILACNMRRALVAPEQCDIPYLLETAAREIDRLRILQTAADELDRLREENERLNRQRNSLASALSSQCGTPVDVLIAAHKRSFVPPNPSPAPGEDPDARR